MSSSISSCRCSSVQSDSENIDNNVSLFMPFGQLSYNESSVPLTTENKKHSMAMVWFSVSLSLSVIVSALHVGDVTKKIFHSCRLPIVGDGVCWWYSRNTVSNKLGRRRRHCSLWAKTSIRCFLYPATAAVSVWTRWRSRFTSAQLDMGKVEEENRCVGIGSTFDQFTWNSASCRIGKGIGTMAKSKISLADSTSTF